jgi:hypothetical protein
MFYRGSGFLAVVWFIGSLPSPLHSKKFHHGKIFICVLHRGHLQESIAKFLICTQLGRIHDVTPLVIKITYLNTADCIILWTGTGGGGGVWAKYFDIFPFSQWHVVLYINKIWLVRRVLWLIRNKLKVMKAFEKKKGFGCHADSISDFQFISIPLYHCTTTSSVFKKKINLFKKLTCEMIVFIVIFSN